MSSARKNSPFENAIVGLFLFVLLPAIASMNYRDFMSEQRGTVVRSYWTGQKSPTLHLVLNNGQELRAWNIWFGPRGGQLVKRSGSFWADTAPLDGPPAWKRVLSVILFVPAVVMPALLWIGLICGAFGAACTAIARPFRAAPALPSNGTGVTPTPAVRATAIDTNRAEPRAERATQAATVVERAFGGCPACGVERSGAVVPCGTCGARHFESCWANHRTCNDAGCDGRPVTRRVAA